MLSDKPLAPSQQSGSDSDSSSTSKTSGGYPKLLLPRNTNKGEDRTVCSVHPKKPRAAYNGKANGKQYVTLAIAPTKKLFRDRLCKDCRDARQKRKKDKQRARDAKKRENKRKQETAQAILEQAAAPPRKRPRKDEPSSKPILENLPSLDG